MDGLEEGCGQEDVGRREGRREMEEWSLLNSSWALVDDGEDDDGYMEVLERLPRRKVKRPKLSRSWKNDKVRRSHSETLLASIFV